MFKFISKLFKRKTKQHFVHPIFETAKDKALSIQYDLKKEDNNRKERQVQLTKMYTETLNGLVAEYFKSWSSDNTENIILFTQLDKRWKQYCVNANRSQKYVKVEPKAFESTVFKVIEKSIKENDKSN